MSETGRRTPDADGASQRQLRYKGCGKGTIAGLPARLSWQAHLSSCSLITPLILTQLLQQRLGLPRHPALWTEHLPDSHHSGVKSHCWTTQTTMEASLINAFLICIHSISSAPLENVTNML